jgi:hypothetical protein
MLEVDRQKVAELAANLGLLHCKIPLIRWNPLLMSPLDELVTNGWNSVPALVETSCLSAYSWLSTRMKAVANWQVVDVPCEKTYNGGCPNLTDLDPENPISSMNCCWDCCGVTFRLRTGRDLMARAVRRWNCDLSCMEAR